MFLEKNIICTFLSLRDPIMVYEVAGNGNYVKWTENILWDVFFKCISNSVRISLFAEPKNKQIGGGKYLLLLIFEI